MGTPHHLEKSASSTTGLPAKIACLPLRIVLAGLLSILSAAAPVRPSEPPPARPKLALLIGIDAYGEELPALRGCVRDVERARRLLIERMGFAAQDVRVLLDGEATHEGIVRAFDEWLLRRATPETEVVFWFSGHGSRVPDRDGERESLDSTFLTADSRAGGRLGEYDLTDDEMNSLLRALTSITPNVVVITDSCHSGGGMRGGAASMARSVAAGVHPLDVERLASFWPRDLRLETSELDPTRYLHLAACAPHQLAFEHGYVDLDGELRSQGALSFFLLNGLERCAPGSTWRQVADEAAVRVSTRYPAQSVWSEGALDRQVFGGDFAPAPEGFLGVQSGPRVLLQAGRLHGLQVGTHLVVRPNLQTAAQDQPLGEIELTHVLATTSSGRWLVLPAGLESGTPLRAVVNGLPRGSRPLRVLAPPELAALLDDDYAVAVEHVEAAQLLLDRSTTGALVLFDTAGHRLWTQTESKPDSQEEALNAALAKELLRQSLFELPTEPGELQVVAHFERPNAAETARFAIPPTDLRPTPGSVRGEQTATGGASNSEPTLAILVVRNEDRRPLHCTVLSLPENRRYDTDQHAIESIWPPASRSLDNLLERGEEIRIPVGIVAPPSWDLERPLRDRFLVIALPEYADFSSYISGTRGADDMDALPGPLQNALAKSATRGVRLRPVDDRPWGIQAVDLFVVPASTAASAPAAPAEEPPGADPDPARSRGVGPGKSESSPRTARWHALLVGCDEYPGLRAAFPERYDEEIRLAGPSNDVALMERILRESFAIASERLTVLSAWGEDPATRPSAANIEGALSRLVREVAVGDEVLLYFSGHGSQQIDGSGDELDGLDEVFLPADVGAAADRFGQIPRALADDRFGRSARRLREAGANVWLVFDCCHSGTMARGGARVRGLDPALFGVEAGARGGLAGEDPRALGRDVGELGGMVALYASESFARTPEIDLPEAGGKRHGLLTWALATELSKGIEERTFRQLFTDVTRAYQERGASDTVPMAEGDLDRVIGSSRRRAPRTVGALGSARRLRVEIDNVGEGGPPGRIAPMLADFPELFELVDQDAQAGVFREGDRYRLHTTDGDVWGVPAEEVVSRLAALHFLERLETSIAAGELPASSGAFTCRAEVRPRSGGPVAPLEDGALLHPGDRVRLRMAKTAEGIFDVFALYADARHGITTLFPRGGASPRLFGALAEEVELSGGWSDVTDDTQGPERVLVLAFAREAGDPLIELGGLAWLAGARGGAGALEGLLGLLTGTGARGGDVIVPSVETLHLRCEWPTLTAPTWPRRGVIPVTRVTLGVDFGLGLDTERTGTDVSRAALVRSPASGNYDVLLLGDEASPRVVLFDFDGERREQLSEGDLTALVAGDAFDAELAVYFLPEHHTALYDTTGDGALDLILLDQDRDGWADMRLGARANQPVHLPLLSQSYLPPALRDAVEPSRWTSHLSILAGGI